MNSRPNTDEAAGRKPRPPIVLDGYRLRFAQAACVALTALSVGLFFASIFPAYEQLSTVCEGDAGCVYPRLFPEDAKALEGLGGSEFYAVYHITLALALVLGFWVMGAILFWKSSRQLMALYASIALVTFGTVQADTIHWLADAHARLDLLSDLVYFVGPASFFVLFCMFPDGRFVPRWTRWVAVASIIYWLLGSFFPDSSPISPRSWPLVIDASLFLGLIGSLVVAQIYRYQRVSGPDEKQQTKWVVWGFTVYIVILIVVLVISWIFSLTRPGIPQVFHDLVSTTVIILSTLLIPLAIGVAILRYHLWNIELIIRRTLVYGSLSLVLTAVFSITDTILQSLFFFITGVEESWVATFGSVIVIAVGFQPLRNRIEGGVDRLVDRLFGGDRVSESLRREEDTAISPPSNQ
jgi:hypothetical protein